jgi:hypothetical protein
MLALADIFKGKKSPCTVLFKQQTVIRALMLPIILAYHQKNQAKVKKYYKNNASPSLVKIEGIQDSCANLTIQNQEETKHQGPWVASQNIFLNLQVKRRSWLQKKSKRVKRGQSSLQYYAILSNKL